MSRRAALAPVAPLALLLAAPAAAQNGVVDLDFTGGALGGPLQYTVDALPGKVFILVPSFTEGPTPLALIDPLSPGSIPVGFDLPQFIRIKVAPGGAGYPLPADPSFAGARLRAVAITVPGTTTFVDGVSNLAAFEFALPGGVHETYTPNFEARIDFTLTQLADESFVVLGGDASDPLFGTVTISDTGERYDPETQTFEDLGSVLQHPRSTHTATLLDDGRILVAGGYDHNFTVRATAEIYDPTTNTSAPVPAMSTPRSTHTAVELDDGRVWVLGGTSLFDLSDPLASIESAIASSELFDPVTNQWSPGPSYPSLGIGGHTATLLDDGRVLVVGGITVEQIFIFKVPSVTNEALAYVPGTNSFQDVPDLPAERAFHAATSLAGNRALVAGGGTADLLTLTSMTHANAWVYDAGGNQWSAVGSLASPRAYHELVGSGSLAYAVGGFSTVDIVSGVGVQEPDVEEFDLGALGWTGVGTQTTDRWTAEGALTENGARLVLVGEGTVVGGPTITLHADVFVLP